MVFLPLDFRFFFGYDNHGATPGVRCPFGVRYRISADALAAVPDARVQGTGAQLAAPP